MRNLLDENEPLISGLVFQELTTSEILITLGNGGKIEHIKEGWVVWLEGSKLNSDSIGWVGSLPQFIFNQDIKWKKA